ncbi:MAG TPA: response regulator [Rhizobacter sp.]|nr:response regulator [Rhizobacter sp.]
MTLRVLLVDDDAELRTLLVGYLQRYGMQVTAVGDGTGLRRTLPTGRAGSPQPFDLLLLDLMLPDVNGLALCQWVREHHPLPIIMLTAQGDPASRIVGLEFGADDYLPKPFEPRELVARIHAVLRRGGPRPATASAEPASVVRFVGWAFDRLRRQLTSPAQVVLPLSSAEFRLLSTFVDHPRRVLSRDRLLELTQSPGADVTDRSIDLAVSRLRQKLDMPQLIRTVRGEGYVFEADPTP